jgi:Domain of unknown function (DUF4234)
MANPNPYAPPSTLDAPTSGATSLPVSDYRGERRSVLLCIVLTMVTFGLYPAIWLLRRNAFLQTLNASKKPVVAHAYVYIVLSAVSIVLGVAGKDGAPVANFASLIGGVAQLLASFRVASMLSSDFARTGRLLSVSKAATFFLGVYYLQYKINRASEIPARIPKES